MDETIIEFLIEHVPGLAAIITTTFFIFKYLFHFFKEYRTMKKEKDDAHAKEIAKLQQEAKEHGSAAAERDAYKANHEHLQKEYYRQQEVIKQLDTDIHRLTESIKTESAERKKDGERLDQLIKIHDNLGKQYSEMNDVLKTTLKEMSDAIIQFKEITSKINNKVSNMEDDIDIIKRDIKNIKNK